ncbi:MAG: tyrosine-type recombinase/integrase [Akkermansia sp.]|nr:tyrosine-type recombinase/integrase [Akkermansia sp.]
MAGLTQRNGMWYATWKKQNGTTEKKSTKVPVKGRDGISAKQSKAYAQQVADSMERIAKGQTTYTQAADALRLVAQASGMGVAMPTVRDFLTDFQGQASPKTEKNRRRAFKSFLAWMDEHSDKKADIRLDMLTKADIMAYFKHELTLVSVGTVGLHRTNLSAAFNKAVDDELLVRSPMPRLNLVKLGKEVNPELGRDKIKRLPFTADELRLMVTQFPAPWCDMSLVAAMTGGQRIGDICCLRWDCIDFVSGSLCFNTAKTDKEMDIPMHSLLRDRLLAIQAEQRGQEEYVFPNMARRYMRGDGSVSTEFTSLLKAWGIVKISTEKKALKGNRRNVSPKSFHSFRHSVVTALRTNSSITADLARAIVGHDSEEVERQYCTASRDDKMRGLDIIAQAISAPEKTSMPPYPARTA